MLYSAYLLSDPLLHNISFLILVFQALWCGGMGILITICTRKINIMSQCKLICVSWPTGIFALKSQLFWNIPVAIAHGGYNPDQQNRKIGGLQLVYCLEVFGPWIIHPHFALHTKYLVSNYLCVFFSSFSMALRPDSNNYSAFINLLDSSADAWSHLLFIWLV